MQVVSNVELREPAICIDFISCRNGPPGVCTLCDFPLQTFFKRRGSRPLQPSSAPGDAASSSLTKEERAAMDAQASRIATSRHQLEPTEKKDHF